MKYSLLEPTSLTCSLQKTVCAEKEHLDQELDQWPLHFCRSKDALTMTQNIQFSGKERNFLDS
jgi:hypothetical protein